MNSIQKGSMTVALSTVVASVAILMTGKSVADGNNANNKKEVVEIENNSVSADALTKAPPMSALKPMPIPPPPSGPYRGELGGVKKGTIKANRDKVLHSMPMAPQKKSLENMAKPKSPEMPSAPSQPVVKSPIQLPEAVDAPKKPTADKKVVVEPVKELKKDVSEKIVTPSKPKTPGAPTATLDKPQKVTQETVKPIKAEKPIESFKPNSPVLDMAGKSQANSPAAPSLEKAVSSPKVAVEAPKLLEPEINKPEISPSVEKKPVAPSIERNVAPPKTVVETPKILTPQVSKPEMPLSAEKKPVAPSIEKNMAPPKVGVETPKLLTPQVNKPEMPLSAEKKPVAPGLGNTALSPKVAVEAPKLLAPQMAPFTVKEPVITTKKPSVPKSVTNTQRPAPPQNMNHEHFSQPRNAGNRMMPRHFRQNNQQAGNRPPVWQQNIQRSRGNSNGTSGSSQPSQKRANGMPPSAGTYQYAPAHPSNYNYPQMPTWNGYYYYQMMPYYNWPVAPQGRAAAPQGQNRGAMGIQNNSNAPVMNGKK